jgi:hypothetical protein
MGLAGTTATCRPRQALQPVIDRDAVLQAT